MEYRQMGKWGVRLSSLGLGSYLTIGFKVDEKTSRALVRTAYDAGVNFFDTANAYNRGEAEKVLGKCLREFPRSSYVLATKVWAPMGPGPNDRGLSAKHVFEQCHASLRRLGMDYIDIYFCHRPDPSTPLEETVRAMEDLARQGKILYWGISEWPPTLILRAQQVARELGARPISVSQPRYNLLYRYPERDLFPLTREEGIGNVTFSPLAHGMLTGKYLPPRPASTSGHQGRRSRAEPGHHEALLDRGEQGEGSEAGDNGPGDGSYRSTAFDSLDTQEARGHERDTRGQPPGAVGGEPEGCRGRGTRGGHVRARFPLPTS